MDSQSLVELKRRLLKEGLKTEVRHLLHESRVLTNEASQNIESAFVLELEKAKQKIAEAEFVYKEWLRQHLSESPK